MKLDIKHEPLSFDLHGVGGWVWDTNYAGAAFKLMEGLWPVIKEKGIKNTGINYWVYKGPNRLFTCVELIDGDGSDIFEHVPIELKRYAYYKHIGPYERLGEVYTGIHQEFNEQLLAESGVAVEKYGHWTDDISKLETEIFIGLR
ncbi:MAG: hypothetical protein JO314_13000 [Acidobacteria bacterium]|nr:hypothetical protein [Acidobacteriota bacterium]